MERWRGAPRGESVAQVLEMPPPPKDSSQNGHTSVSLTHTRARARAPSHVHPRARSYKTIITSPGKLMERQIKN